MSKRPSPSKAAGTRRTRSSHTQNIASTASNQSPDLVAAEKQLNGDLSDLSDIDEPPMKKAKNEMATANKTSGDNELANSDALNSNASKSPQAGNDTSTNNSQASEAPAANHQADDTSKKEPKNVANLVSLPRVAAWCINVDKNLSTTPYVNLNAVFDGTTLERLRAIELLNKLGTGRNLALADPKSLSLNSTGQVCKKDTSNPARFFAIGKVLYSSLFKGENARQLCVSFSDRTFPRMMAVLGAVFQEKVLYTPTFWNGVSLSTYTKSRKQAGAYSPGKGVALPKSPMKVTNNATKKMLSDLPAILPWNEDILVFDGTKSLKNLAIEDLTVIKQELRRDSAVAVIFTVGSYSYSKVSNYIARDPLKTALSFNIQAVVLLARPPQSDVEEKPPSPAIGVDDEPELALFDDELEHGVEGEGNEARGAEEDEDEEGIEI